MVWRLVCLSKCLPQDPKPHVPILYSKHQRPRPLCVCHLWGADSGYRVTKSVTHRGSFFPLLDVEWATLAGEALGSVPPQEPQEPHVTGLTSDNRTWLEHEKPCFFFFFFLFFFLRPHLQHMEVSRIGVESELHLRSMPQTQQHWIRAASATYTTACSNVGSLTYWMRPGIKLASSQTLGWILNPLSHKEDSEKRSPSYLSSFSSTQKHMTWEMRNQEKRIHFLSNRLSRE